MAWRRPGDKPLSEPMMVRLPTHICVTRPQWVKDTNAQLWWFLCARWVGEIKCQTTCSMYTTSRFIITVTSWMWMPWRLESAAFLLFIQQLKSKLKKTSTLRITGPLWNPPLIGPLIGGYPSQSHDVIMWLDTSTDTHPLGLLHWHWYKHTMTS